MVYLCNGILYLRYNQWDIQINIQIYYTLLNNIHINYICKSQKQKIGQNLLDKCMENPGGRKRKPALSIRLVLAKVHVHF